MDQKLKQAAIDLYDRFTHEGLDRRVFMSRMIALAGSAAAAEALTSILIYLNKTYSADGAGIRFTRLTTAPPIP